MGVPFEALLPYGIIIGVSVAWLSFPTAQLTRGQMFGITGAGLSIVKYYSNDHKKARWNRDAWDRVSLVSCITRVYVD
jgi:hypothetical protein